MPKAEVTLKITPTELEIVKAALTVYAATLGRIEAKSSNLPQEPFDASTLLFADNPFTGRQMANRLLRDLS